MKRLTKLSKNKEFYNAVDDKSVKCENEGHYGDAIEKLAKFENFYDHLASRQKSIPTELEALRSGGKTKTVTFKELLAEKMINDMILTQLADHGLE
jgi:hypothetical protein